MIYNILRNRPVTVLEPRFEIGRTGPWFGVLSGECIPGIGSDVDGIIGSIDESFRQVIIDIHALVLDVNDSRLNDAKATARRLDEALGFSGLFTGIVGRVKRGVRVSNDDWVNAIRLVHEDYVRRIYNEVGRKYTILDAGKYAIVTNGPPGIYKLPDRPEDVDGLLASLGLGVIVRDAIDIDVVFTNVLRSVVDDYAKVLLEAYMRLRPTGVWAGGLKPWLAPMVARSLEAGHLAIIRGNRVFEYPSIIVNRDNVIDVFDSIIRLGWV